MDSLDTKGEFGQASSKDGSYWLEGSQVNALHGLVGAWISSEGCSGLQGPTAERQAC